ncbi:ROK family protein [Agromyces mediolanus]|uniref:ROK family protein n=1 Tax=Agromyces mediolanus TaxID=41986 RepID=UPI00203FB395|nr:ROK family protein [Agromyces mediolanus]MCM3658269.1 ROK family protein [Agromyces mediolanus]
MSRTTPVLALDIGGTKLATAVILPDGTTVGFLSEPTRKERPADEVLRSLFDQGSRSMAAAGVDVVSAVGISCGGPLDAAAGVLTGPLHLPGWIDVPIVAMAQEYYGVPAVLENDATAAALGEYRYGAAQGAEIALYLTISTGIGGGAVIGGELHRGAAGNGGEFGHITVQRGGRECLCGRRGCLEAYASGTSIARRAAELLADDPRDSALRRYDPVRAEHVSQCAADGDAVAQEIWDETTALIGQAVTDLVNVFEPDIVVLGGGVTRSGALLLDPVADLVRRGAMAPAATAGVVLAALGDQVGVVGAAALAFDLTYDLDLLKETS